MIIGLFQSSISAVRVLKTYRYDWNIYYKSSMNSQRYNYINSLLWYSCYQWLGKDDTVPRH